MEIKTIEYSRVFNLGGYENKKVGVICEVEETETPEQALEQAIEFVEMQDPTKAAEKKRIADSEFWRDIENKICYPEQYTEEEVLEAIKLKRKKAVDDLPF